MSLKVQALRLVPAGTNVVKPADDVVASEVVHEVVSDSPHPAKLSSRVAVVGLLS